VGARIPRCFQGTKGVHTRDTNVSDPQPDQPLILYVSAMHTIVSGSLVKEREVSKEDKKISHEVPIYFVSKALAGSKKYTRRWKKYDML
jgi:hypothetical protein